MKRSCLNTILSGFVLFSLIFPDAALAAGTGDVEPYSFTLAPGKTARPDEYSRKEIESFLCAAIPNYIESTDVYKISRDDTYGVKAKHLSPKQKEELENREICKWFEETVTVTSRGNVTVLDKKSIGRFFDTVNQVIGKKKFVYKPGLEIANIVIVLASPDSTGEVQKYLGETSVLEDDLRVRLTLKNRKVQVETYKAGRGILLNRTQQIDYTPGEKEFMKENRLVKVYIRNILDPLRRHGALTHELLHATGLPGHSPYYESNLFPLAIKVPYSGLSGPVIAPLAGRMVEMLYRPEILAGMTIKKAGLVLTQLKHKNKTPKEQIIAFLAAEKKVLEKQKQDLLEEEKRNYEKRTAGYIKLDRLVRKERWFLEELEEIKVDNKISTKIVETMAAAPSLTVKLSLIRTEIILLKAQKRRLTEETSKAAWKTRRQVKLIDEQLVVLNDLLKVAGEIDRVEKEIENTRLFKRKTEVETTLRRILRQLTCIERQLVIYASGGQGPF
jgi:hypothetical protein